MQGIVINEIIPKVPELTDYGNLHKAWSAVNDGRKTGKITRSQWETYLHYIELVDELFRLMEKEIQEAWLEMED